jgi:hypothetical protein
LSSPIVVHVVRPYSSEDEYLEKESWSIDAKSMLLIDQAELPGETTIVFDVQLRGGHKPIRAEAKVTGAVAPSGGRPGGLRVRFKRFGSATKSFIDRAVAVSKAKASPAASQVSSVLSAPNEAKAAPAERKESSGIHQRPAGRIAAPANREELLQRLRGRVRPARTATTAGEQVG